MPNPEKPPIFSILDSSEAIYSRRKKFRFVLLWAFVASVWIIVVSAMFFIYAFGPVAFESDDLEITAILALIVGVPLFVASVFVLPYSWSGANKIENFMADFYPLWVRMQVEVENIGAKEDNDSLNLILERLVPSYRNLKSPSRLSKRIKEELEGFDLIMHKGKKLSVAKVIPLEEVLEREQILALEKETVTKAKSIRCRIRFFVLVQNQYAGDLSEWEDDDHLVKKGATVVFLLRTENGLRVKWVSPISKGHLKS